MIEETPEHARQGRRGKPVAIVLMVSLALGLIALIGLVLWALTDEASAPEEPRTGQTPALTAPADRPV
jgi:flagellar basal body-associated protein FliL